MTLRSWSLIMFLTLRRHGNEGHSSNTERGVNNMLTYNWGRRLHSSSICQSNYQPALNPSPPTWPSSSPSDIRFSWPQSLWRRSQKPTLLSDAFQTFASKGTNLQDNTVTNPGGDSYTAFSDPTFTASGGNCAAACAPLDYPILPNSALTVSYDILTIDLE